jgi:hypothetical protein
MFGLNCAKETILEKKQFYSIQFRTNKLTKFIVIVRFNSEQVLVFRCVYCAALERWVLDLIYNLAVNASTSLVLRT